MTRLEFDPLLPWPLIAALAGVAALAVVIALARGLKGWPLRALAAAGVVAALAGPTIETAVRQGLSDIVLLVDDTSASQSLPGRTAQTTDAVERLSRTLTALPNIELRRVTVGDSPDGTLLGAEISRALAAEPAARVAGVIVVTDGQAHDAAALPTTAPAPVHVLLTGQPQDWDRRLVIEEAPAFGLIDQRVSLRLRVEDQGDVPEGVSPRTQISISMDGEPPQLVEVPTGISLELPVTPTKTGQNVVALSIADPGGSRPQLSTLNDQAVVQIEGVRDRLRVLLVSGEPHPGSRVWRNLLKSDPNVDLVHFTILRPPEKMDGVPVDELALIAFPTEALFQERIGDFDLIILDRYRVRGILPPAYFDNIRRYVEEGGALLVASGPEMAGVESLHRSLLAPVLPAYPTGRISDGAFLPMVTDEGERHPITTGLAGTPDPARLDAPHWGRWLRMSEVEPDPDAQVLLSGNDEPLLIAKRVGEGRVALLTSDQVWLWGRGFEGGGPQSELLRRVAHWSMKEPDLEEEALDVSIAPDLTLGITRRTMTEDVGPVTVTLPDGSTQQVALTEEGEGRFVGNWQAPAPGLYRLTEGDLTRVAAVGPAAPREFEQTVASGEQFAPLIEATGGSLHRLSDGIPDLRPVRIGRPASGEGVQRPWIGVTPREAEAVEGLDVRPLLPVWAWLALIAALAIAAWLVEGGRLFQRKQTS